MYLFIYLLTPAYNLLEFVSLFITFFMCLIISFTDIHDINTRIFLFHSDDDIYILETIKTLTETNKCFIIEALLGVSGNRRMRAYTSG